MIEEAVLQRTLQTALRHGGDFAEVFAEDRRSASARLDDAKVEEFVSGRERGAGIRVVRGDTTGFAHTADLSEAGLQRRPPTPPRPPPGAPRARPDVAALERRDGPPDRTRSACCRRRWPRPARPRCSSGPTTPPASVSDSIRQVSATYADSRRRVLIANSDGLLVEDDRVRTRFGVNCVAVGDTGMQTGIEAPGRTLGFEIFDEIDPEEVARTAAERALTMLAGPSGAARQAARRAQARRGRRAVPRGVRPRPRSRPGRQGRVGVPRARGRARRVAARHAGRRRHVRARVGHLRDRRRRRARAAQRAHRGRRPHRLHVGPRAGAQARTREQRQRPARDVPAPADGAHDQHVPARGRRRSRRHHPRHRARPLLRRARRRPGRTPPPATSCSASPRRT